MFKNIIAIILLSIAVLMAMSYAHQAIEWLLTLHNWISEGLKQIFNGGQAGNLTRELIVLLAAPVVIGLIPTLIYWIAKRAWFPYFMQCVWISWLVQTSALIVLYQIPAV